MPSCNAAQDYLASASEALDKQGEAGLQKALDPIYPDTDLQSEELKSPKGILLHGTRAKNLLP